MNFYINKIKEERKENGDNEYLCSFVDCGPSRDKWLTSNQIPKKIIDIYVG